MRYLKQLWIAVDQLLNALLGGWPDETLSARCWRERHKRHYAIAVRVINTLFWWQSNHCRGAFAKEVDRAHTAVAYRTAMRDS